MDTLLSIGYIFMSLIPKNRQILLRTQAAKFSFQKITKTLKINVFDEILPSTIAEKNILETIFKFFLI